LANVDTHEVRDKLRQTYRPTKEEGEGVKYELSDNIDEVVLSHTHQVRRIARRTARSTGGAIDVDDMFSVGIIGLIQAFHAYDPSGGRPFAVYAEYRIRGAMLDEMRRLDPMSQPMRKKTRKMDKAINQLSHTLGRSPTEEELAAHMEISVEDLRRHAREIQQHRLVAYEDGRVDDFRLNLNESDNLGPGTKLALAQAIQTRPERLQQLLSLYYFHDLSLKEIGAVLTITEARVCQLHKKAVLLLRDYMEL
jgi:RNA polymerase sigma factor for flagellar operon FliA